MERPGHSPTVEMACLKISCSSIVGAENNGVFIEAFLMRPESFTPLCIK